MKQIVLAVLMAAVLIAKTSAGPFEHLVLPYGIAPPGLEFLAVPEQARGVLVDVRMKEGVAAPQAVKVRLRYRRHGEATVRWREQTQALVYPQYRAAVIFTVGPVEVMSVELEPVAWPEGEE